MEGGLRDGILFVLSAPSGTGKSTLAHRLVERVPALEFSVSYTTRTRRGEERDGEDYHFIEQSQFDAMRRDGALLESADVFGHSYGTGVARTREVLAQGRDLLLDIDVEGARQVRNGEVPHVTVMLLPPDYATLVERLRGRGRESATELERRLARARLEAEQFAEFDYVVINDRLDQTALELESIVRAERRRSARSAGEVEAIIRSFPG